MNAVLTALLLLAAPLRAPAEPAVVGIRVDPAPGATELSIALGGAARARVREPLIIGERARIDIDIPGATLNVNRRGFDDPRGAILALRASHDLIGTHISIDLPADRKYEVRRGANGLLIVVTNAENVAGEWRTGVPGGGDPPRVVAEGEGEGEGGSRLRVSVRVREGRGEGDGEEGSSAEGKASEVLARPGTANGPRSHAALSPVAAPAAPISISAPQARLRVSSPAVSPISRPGAEGAASLPEPGRSAVTSPSPRPGPKSGPSPRPGSAPGVPTPAQLITLLALVALPSALLALLRRRATAAGQTPAPKAPRTAKPPKARKALEPAKPKPARDAAKLGRTAARKFAKTSAPDLWAARTLAGTDAPALEVARRTGLSQDAVLLLRRRMGAPQAAESAAAGRNVRPSQRAGATASNSAK